MNCARCKYELKPGEYMCYIPTIGSVCYYCAEIYAGDDDLVDIWDGTKIC